jgi:hypothetical protein
MPDVADRLEKLAAYAPAGGVDPEVVWARGRRRQRRRTGTALALAAVVAVLAATVAPSLVDRSRGIDPADRGGAPVLPGVLRQPGGIDPILGQAPGRLSAVGLGEAFSWRTLSRTSPWWAVSATTGESGFLDLPDLAREVDTPVLSADGRMLAYWSTGEVSGTPVVGFQEVAVGDDAAPVVGVTVLDLESGERRTWDIDSTHGLITGGMAWTGDVLRWWAGPLRKVDGLYGGEALAHTWDVRTDSRDASVEDAGAPVSMAGLGEAPGGFLTMERPRRLRWDTDGGTSRIRIVVPDGTPAGAPSVAAISPDGRRLAALVPPSGDAYDDLRPLLVGEVVDGVARLEEVPGVETRLVAGWRSSTEVVVIEDAGVRDGRAPQGVAAWTVDVTTGAQERLIDLDVANTPEFAGDAWRAEVVRAPDTAYAPGPRVLAGGAVALGVLLLAGWRIARSRRGHP